MGRKVHPKVFRLATTQAWQATWFSKQDRFSELLQEDVKIRAYLLKNLRDALIDRIEIERTRQTVDVIIHSAKPGFIIGRAGAGIEELKKKLLKEFYRGRRVALSLNVKEVQKPSLSACIVATQMAMDLEKRMPFRRVMKQGMERVMKAGALGVKVCLSGRLNGAEIARREVLLEGSVPLHNLRADIDFARVPAWTVYGSIGVKVWINRGEVFQTTKSTNVE